MTDSSIGKRVKITCVDSYFVGRKGVVRDYDQPCILPFGIQLDGYEEDDLFYFHDGEIEFLKGDK